MNCVHAIWKYAPEPEVIMPSPANCPAEVRLVSEIRNACHHVSPAAIHCIPKVKDTDRYPSAIGMPSWRPFLKLPIKIYCVLLSIKATPHNHRLMPLHFELILYYYPTELSTESLYRNCAQKRYKIVAKSEKLWYTVFVNETLPKRREAKWQTA